TDARQGRDGDLRVLPGAAAQRAGPHPGAARSARNRPRARARCRRWPVARRGRRALGALWQRAAGGASARSRVGRLMRGRARGRRGVRGTSGDDDPFEAVHALQRRRARRRAHPPDAPGDRSRARTRGGPPGMGRARTAGRGEGAAAPRGEREARDCRRELRHALSRGQEGAAAGRARGPRAGPRRCGGGVRVARRRLRRRAAPPARYRRGRRAPRAGRRLLVDAGTPRTLQKGGPRACRAARAPRVRADALRPLATLQLRRGRSLSRRPLTRDDARAIFASSDTSLLELIDNLLTKGVVVTGDVVLGLAGGDLIYAPLSVLLCAPDRLYEVEEEDK